MRVRWIFFATLLLAVVLPAAAQSGEELIVIGHDSFNFSASVLEAFEEETGIRVTVLRLGDTGTMVNQAVLTRSNPLGDVLYGIDNTFLSRALNADLFIPYESPLLEFVDPEFIIDPELRVTPVDYGDVCLNYDVAFFAERNLPLPSTLADLTDPMYAGLLVVQNPATSSPGLAFLLTTIAVFGENGEYTYLDFWRDLVANDVFIADDWTDAYYGRFSGSGGDGTRPLVVSYASSPPAEVLFATEPLDAAPTGAIIAPNTCFRQIEFVGILAGTQRLEAAQQFVDFMLSREFQEDLPLQMFVFPVNREAELPEVFVEYALIPEQPITLEYDVIDENRQRWLTEWTETVLR
ncbi:MAG: thiamine ABC transporter substrate-binding protein [Aggregatilineales bacterium]